MLRINPILVFIVKDAATKGDLGAVPDKYIMYYRGQHEKKQVKQGKTR